MPTRRISFCLMLFASMLALGTVRSVSAAVDQEFPIEVKVQTTVPPYTFACGDGLYSTIAGYLNVPSVKIANATQMKVCVPGFARPMPVVAVIQNHPAPLVVVLPGISGRADTDFSLLWPKWYADAGYHVLTMNSTFRAEFMDISGQGVSGNIWAESEAIGSIISSFLKVSPISERVTQVGVVGMSYGGVQALILGKLSKEGKLPFEVSSVQAYSPPIKMDRTAELFDTWYNENRWRYTEMEMYYKIGTHHRACPQCGPSDLSQCIMKAALAASFQLELVPVVMRADEKYKLGMLPDGDFFDNLQVKRDHAATWGFNKYAYDLALPFWQRKLNLPNMDDLIISSHLCNLASAQPAKSEIIIAADDPFNAPEDLAEFKQCKHSGAISILPSGGHLGYVGDEWTHAKLLTLFAPSVTQEPVMTSVKAETAR